ncbi:MAG: hypothetical protein ACKVY0_15665 [Prosthecobacter sp.]|uniref:hypothetical protein n=1 Tax=Prosthecobacter sp. TaxID=1965333 RepID=UPI003901B4E7
MSVGWLFCLLAGLAAGQESRPIPIGIEVDAKGEEFEEPEARKAIAAIASDAQNRAWAIFRSQGARLAVFQKDHWSPVKLPGFPPTLKALKLARLQDGTIACLWRDEATADDHVLSRHTTKRHQVLARIPVKLNEPHLLPLADGGLLVTASGRELLRIGKGGADPEIITLPEDAFLPPKKNDDGSSRTGFVPVHAVQDQRGTIWLWSQAMKPMEWEWRLRGLGRFTPQGFSFQDLPGTKPEQPISVVVPWMRNRLAIAVAGVGLFDLDVEKNAMNVFAAPGDELKHIEKIFPAHDDWHLITTPRPTEQEVSVSKTFNAQLELRTQRFYDPQKRTSALFRLRGTQLSPLTWKLDAEPAFGWPDRPVIETKEGFWTCVKGGGLVFVPFAAKGVLKTLDWRNGLTLREPVEMARAGDTQFVVLDRGTGQTCLLPLKPAASVNPAPVRLAIVQTESLLLEDARGRIWGRMADDTFQCWENGRWNVLSVPEKVTQMGSNAFIADAHEQGWFIPMKAGPAAVCDFTTGEWHVFASIEAALVARMRPATRLLLRDFPSLAPVSSAGSPMRAGFLRQSGTLHHFDGRGWKEWKITDIAGPDARVTSPPRFDQDGRFTLAFSGYNWQLMPDGQWRRTEQKADETQRVYHSEEAQPPHDCPVKNVSSTAYDRHGVCWLSDTQRRLWKCIPGCAVPVLQPGEPNPLPDGTRLYEVRMDLAGNAFLRLQFGWHGEKYLAVRSRLPQPESRVTLHAVLADTARIEFGQAAWHTWRIDAGEWSLATDKKEHALTGLLPGEHALEVMAYNADLTPASAGAKLSITIKAADIAEMNLLIQRLGGADLNASEAAARRLRSQGKPALPSLNRSRETADERTRWWLDAVIQQIEMKQGSK